MKFAINFSIYTKKTPMFLAHSELVPRKNLFIFIIQLVNGVRVYTIWTECFLIYLLLHSLMKPSSIIIHITFFFLKLNLETISVENY